MSKNSFTWPAAALLGLLLLAGVLYLSLLAAVIGLLFSLLAILLLLLRRTRRLRQLEAAMELFCQSGFSQTPAFTDLVPSCQGDAIDRIEAVFRQMAGRMADQVTLLKESDTRRRELVADITRDLRAPITSLQGHLEPLLRKRGTLSDEEQTDYLAIAIMRSNQLATLTSELSELASLESPDVRIRPEPFSLPELIQEVLRKFRLPAMENKIRLKMDVASGIPPVVADLGLTERALEHLIGNALYSTPENGRISVCCREDKGRILVCVADTGVGIPAEDLPRLFECFSQKDRTCRDGGGSGVGLAIARRIVELHGGDITVESIVNVGTTFTFFLPKHAAAADHSG